MFHDLLVRLLVLIPMLLSLGVHEWAHAFSASLLGDDTAREEGRLSLNPLVHIDPIGTLVLPLLGIPFGWAKPVPVNPSRFRPEVNMGMGLLFTSLAGPFSNLILALLTTVMLIAVRRSDFTANEGIYLLLTQCIELNLCLAVFNLLPVPPLDGSRIVDGLIPFEWRPTWERISKFGVVLLLAVVLLPTVAGVAPLSWVSHLSQWLIALAD